ncbi:MAG: MCE family protein [Planctomycetes bacterium]|nr:MCE family protein [Planctomycetota bacterium]MCB9871936.1 MCE family protein [Planctomycetota bacterium]
MRKKTRTRRFKIGLVVLGSGGMFSALVLFILGSSLSTDLVGYGILFEESVKGMVVGSKVNFQGVPVGAVSDIRFENGRTRVEIAIDPRKAVIQDVTVARMDRLLVTGQVTIELDGYSPKGKSRAPGSLIAARKSPFDEFAQSLPDVVNDAGDLLAATRRLVARLTNLVGDDNQKHFGETLANAAKVSRDLAEHVGPLLRETRDAVGRLHPAVASMEASIRKIGAVAGSEELAGALANARNAMAHIDRIETEVLNLVQDLRGMVGGGRRGWVGTLATAQAALDEIRLLARNLRIAPSQLLYGRSEKEIQVPARPPVGK